MADTWISRTEANTYFSKSFGADFWSALTDSEKDKLLFTSKNYIQGIGYEIAEDNTDDNVKKAQSEVAQYIYNNNRDINKRRALYAMGVREFFLLSLQEKLAMEQLPANILSLLKPYKTEKSTYLQRVERKIIRG